MGRPVFLILSAFIVLSCNSEKTGRLFSVRSGEDIGIDFRNDIISNDSVNALSFEYIYNGSGVGIGDFNSDGLEDVFFGGNDVSSELYLNRGNLKFEKVSDAAGIKTKKWITGVSVIDINVDGLPDIYLSVGGKTSPDKRKNILFINTGIKNGIPTFEDQAKAYGLDDSSYSTMAAFFDYDKDGDADMYLVNNWLEQFNRNNLRPKRINGEAESTDKLYRNNGNKTFTDVSSEAGILIEGYGLGVSITDINLDSWPDVYVSNDFLSNDLLWINKGDGTFENRIGEYLKHQTHNGMGIDVADFNNDQLSDIIVVDMLPPDHRRQKLMTPGQNHDHFHLSLTLGYEAQYMRNTLQLNRGKNANGDVVFSEIAFQAGVAQTDWSWAPLFLDLDNDGWKDLFIANGYRKDVTNLDFIFFGFKNVTPFGTSETRKTITDNEFKKIEDVKLTNRFFRNSGGLAFDDVTAEWAEEIPTFTNGTACADFDNDGDLDLITSNIDQEVIFYENKVDKRNFVKLKSREPFSCNEKIRLYANGQVQFQEATPYRGFQSTISSSIHFGLGDNSIVDSVTIEWPDGGVATYYDIRAGNILQYGKSDAKPYQHPGNASPLFKFQQEQDAFWTHQEKSPSDIKVTRTLMHELGNFGPCYAKADVNNDGLDDFFFGRETGEPGIIHVQQNDGKFREVVFSNETMREDGAALFFDADNDNDQDLYIAGACSSGFANASPHRLFVNDGQGRFSLNERGLPEISVSSLTVQPADYDNDGDVDLFVGGHLKAHRYPYHSKSYLLRNDGGVFKDVTEEVAGNLSDAGLVTTSLWTDLNNDGFVDLVVAGEWMPIRVFLNSAGKLTDATNDFGLQNSHGWWNTLKAIDNNADGFPEIIAGNTGQNSYFKPTEENPLIILADDFDKNGSLDPIFTYYNPKERERFVVHNRLVLIDQIPAIKRRMQTFTQFATSSVDEIFTEEEMTKAYKVHANTFTSVLLQNHSGTRLSMEALPEIAQLSTINDVLTEDLNGDGKEDLVIVGNNYNQETLFGRYDASVGTILLASDKGWLSVPHHETGFTADGDVRHIAAYKTPFGRRYLLLQNNDSAVTYQLLKRKNEDPRTLAAGR